MHYIIIFDFSNKSVGYERKLLEKPSYVWNFPICLRRNRSKLAGLYPTEMIQEGSVSLLENFYCEVIWKCLEFILCILI